jgi:DNA-binding transcriptional ArsR family regulator
MSVVQWLIRVARASSPNDALSNHILANALRAVSPFMPGCTTPIPPTHDTQVADQVERLLASDGSELEAEIAVAFGTDPPRPWAAAANESRRWMHSLARASTDCWLAHAHSWRRASGRLKRESERVGTAAVTGTLDTLLNTLHPKLRFEAGALRMVPCEREPEGDRFRGVPESAEPIDHRRLVLVPMVVPNLAVVANFDDDDLVYIAYALPRTTRGGEAPDALGDDALGSLLGPVKADALHFLRNPRTMGDLARHLNCAPSTATYHCQQLVAAGLVSRERRAQSMWLRRTRRGEELLEVLAGRRPGP